MELGILHRWFLAKVVVAAFVCLCGGAEASAGGVVVSDSVEVCVRPVDGTTDYPLSNAKVMVRDTMGRVLCDSLPMVIREASWRETYDRVMYRRNVVRQKKYNIRVSASGYEDKELTFSVPDEDSFIDMGAVYMHHPRAEAKRLNEVTVTATKVKMVMKGDTLEYDATAFRLPEGSMLDALIASLPGATLSNDGQITVNGKFVSELLVNGRKFFSGDPTVALRNLPSFTVKNVQVYHKAPEEFRGVKAVRDRSNDPLVMDVNLKREYMGGWIANAEAGAGSAFGHGWDTRWMGRMFGMRYDKYSYIALHASANNLNDPMKAGSKGQWYKPSVSAGEITTKRAGIEYNTDWHDQQRNGINTTLEVVRQTALTGGSESAEAYMAGGNVFSRSASESDRATWNLNWNGEISRKIAGFGRIWFHTGVGYSNGAETRKSSSARSNSMLPDNFTTPGSAEWKEAMTYLRRQAIDLRDSKFSTNWRTYITWSELTSCTIGLNGNGTYENLTSKYSILDRVNYPMDSARDFLLRQHDSSPGRNWDYTLNPYWFSNLIRFSDTQWFNIAVRYTYNQKYDHGRRTLEEVDEDVEPLDNVEIPSMGNAWIVDEANSYRTTRREWNNNLSPEFNFTLRRFILNLTGSAAYNKRSLDDYRDFTARHLDRNDWLYGGAVRMGLGSSQWSLDYGLELNYTEKAPDIMQLLDVRDSSDPLRIMLGNGALRKSNEYRASIFTSKQFRNRQSSYDFNISYSRTDNAIAQARSYNRRTGVTTWQPRNINGNWQAGGDFSYRGTLDRQRRLNISNSLRPQFRHSVDFSSDTDIPQRVAADLWTLGDRLKLDYEFSIPLKLSARADFDWTRQSSCNGMFSTFSFMDINYGIGVQYTMPWGLSLDTDLMAYCRRGYADPSMNTTDWVWNLQLSKTFGRTKQFTVKAIGFDLLQQLPTVKQVVNAQGRTESRYNSQPAYALLTLTYRLDIKPQKK